MVAVSTKALNKQSSSKRVSSSPSQNDDPPEDDTPQLLHNYFNLAHPLPALYSTWSAADKNFARRSTSFGGIRIINQDPWEALVSFICSSNNNISRISGMISRLCARFGPHIGRIGDEDFHDLPDPYVLAAAGSETESALRDLGFGYRARYIADTARLVAKERPAGWLTGLRNPSSPSLRAASAGVETGAKKGDAALALPDYRTAHDALLELPGVGPKVADCVCLMGLGWAEAVPVDTHVWQIAKRDYKFGGSTVKTLNKATYDAVGDHFRGIWGPFAGWAQSVLFTANLKSFAEQAAGGGKKGVKVEEEGSVKLEQDGETVTGVTTKSVKKRKVSTLDETPLKVEVAEKIDTKLGRTRSRTELRTGTRTSKRLKVSA